MLLITLKKQSHGISFLSIEIMIYFFINLLFPNMESAPLHVHIHDSAIAVPLAEHFVNFAFKCSL